MIFPVIASFILFLSSLTMPVFELDPVSLEFFDFTRMAYNRQGMYVLGSWALLNLCVGVVGAFKSKGQIQAFHQMNAYWNLVNLGIAGFGLWQARQGSLVINFWEILNAQQQIEKVLLFNAALDLAYLSFGFFLIERGRRLVKDNWIGFGKSILLQGAFLLLFDVILYGFQHQLGIELLDWAKSM